MRELMSVRFCFFGNTWRRKWTDLKPSFKAHFVYLKAIWKRWSKTGGTQQSFYGEAPPQSPNTSLLDKVPGPFVYPLLTNCRYPFTYRFRGVASPFWWSLPEKAVIGSNVIAPWDPKSPETFFLLFHKELRNAHSFLSSLCTVGSDTQASSCLNVPGKPRTPIPEECRTLAVACVAGVERGRG